MPFPPLSCSHHVTSLEDVAGPAVEGGVVVVDLEIIVDAVGVEAHVVRKEAVPIIVGVKRGEADLPVLEAEDVERLVAGRRVVVGGVVALGDTGALSQVTGWARAKAGEATRARAQAAAASLEARVLFFMVSRAFL